MNIASPNLQLAKKIKIDVNFRTISSTESKFVFKLNPKEYELLLYFMENPDRLITRNQILDNVWGMAALVRTNSIDVYIGSLRKKLKLLCGVNCIETIHGSGFIFDLLKLSNGGSIKY